MQRSQARLKNGPFSVLWSAFHRWEGCWKTCGRKALRAGAHAEGSARGQNGLHGRSGGLAGSSKTERRTGLVRDERPGGQGEPFRGLGEGELFQGAAGLAFSRNTAAGGGGRTTSRPAAREERRHHQARLIGIPPGIHSAAGLNGPTSDPQGLCVVGRHPSHSRRQAAL